MKVFDSNGEVILEKETTHLKTARMSSAHRHPNNKTANKHIHPIVVTTEDFLSQIPTQ